MNQAPGPSPARAGRLRRPPTPGRPRPGPAREGRRNRFAMLPECQRPHPSSRLGDPEVEGPAPRPTPPRSHPRRGAHPVREERLHRHHDPQDRGGRRSRRIPGDAVLREQGRPVRRRHVTLTRCAVTLRRGVRGTPGVPRGAHRSRLLRRVGRRAPGFRADACDASQRRHKRAGDHPAARVPPSTSHLGTSAPRTPCAWGSPPRCSSVSWSVGTSCRCRRWSKQRPKPWSP